MQILRGIDRSWFQFGGALLLVALPFLTVTFPPATDLPQHLCQVRLLLETLESGDGPYTVSWFAPNTLVYLPLTCAWLLFSPVVAGKVTLLLLALSWVAASFLLARRLGRPPEAAVLASTLVFNFMLYWGFLNFLIGWPVFVLWILQLARSPRGRGWWALLVLSLLLYASHSLWLVCGGLCLVATSARHWRDWKAGLLKLAAMVPSGAAALVWWNGLSAYRAQAGFDVSARWISSPAERLGRFYFLDSLMGGLQGGAEMLVGAALGTWIVMALWTHRGRLRRTVDGHVLLCSTILLAGLLLAPDRYMNTLFLPNRWLTGGVILLLVALPAPRWKPRNLAFLAFGPLVILSVATTRSWMEFEETELDGLQQALDRLPGGGRVLGLNFFDPDFAPVESELKGQPFIQIFAYAQAVKGGELAFSFAEHAAGIVRYRRPRQIRWTRGMEEDARRFTEADLVHFDHVLVNAPAQVQAGFARIPSTRPLTTEGRWRLYAVRR